MAAMENSMADAQRILNGIIIWSYNTSLSYLPKKTENKDSKKFMYTRVHSSAVHNNQKVEAVQIPLTGEW